jgi:hypothetical protein
MRFTSSALVFLLNTSILASSTMAQRQPHRSKEMVSSSTHYHRGFPVSTAEDKEQIDYVVDADVDGLPASSHVQLTRELQESNCWSLVGDAVDGVTAGDQSGISVAMSANGKRSAIGNQYNNGNGNAGHVRIFQVDGTTVTQVGGGIDAEVSDESGVAVAMSADGNRVIVGAPLKDSDPLDEGHARVFELVEDSSDPTATSIWVQLGSDLDGDLPGNLFGYSVAMSADGNRVIIGTGMNVGSDVASGYARAFEFVLGSWVRLGTDIIEAFEVDGTVVTQLGDALGGEASEESGVAVAMSADGTRVIVCAPFKNGDFLDEGRARVFELVAEDASAPTTWLQLGSDLDGEFTGNFFGYSVAMSADGNRVIVGAPFKDTNGVASGNARVFEFDAASWVQRGAEIDGEFAGDQSGFSVAISADGNRVIIGARMNDGNGVGSGYARAFDLVDAAWIPAGLAINGEAASDESGTSVAMSADGNLIIIGAPLNDGSSIDAGNVRVYKAEVRCSQCPSFLRLAF